MVPISDEALYMLDRMNSTAQKYGLGTLIRNAETLMEGDTVALDDGYILVGQAGTDLAGAVLMSGDATISNAGVLTIGAGKVLETMLKVQGTTGLHASRIAVAQYSFATHGGAVSPITLGVTLPDKAVILRSWIEVLTAFTSTGNNGTIAFHAQAANDILSAVDADTLITGFNDGVSTGVAANMKKCTAARLITATIGTNALLSGKANVYVEYIVAPA